jgi:hypothetical protein
MSDAWLSDVLLSPDDDGPRVAWMNAHRASDPLRARFVEIGLVIAEFRRRGREADAALRGEAGRLATVHGPAWAGPAASLKIYEFRRGFVETVYAKPRDILTQGDRIWRAQPILDLHLVDTADRLAELLRWPGLHQLRSLHLRGLGLGDRDAIALGASPLLANLRAIDLANNHIGPDGFYAIADGLRALRWASFSNNRVVDPLEQLLEAPEAGLSDVGRVALDRFGPLPWLSSPVFGPYNQPFPEQL